jgi:hypothetical protein
MPWSRAPSMRKSSAELASSGARASKRCSNVLTFRARLRLHNRVTGSRLLTGPEPFVVEAQEEPGLTNAERQARWRERRESRLRELEAENALLAELVRRD